MPESHPTLAWMVEHVAWILTSRVRGIDGRTAFQRIRGRPFNKRLLEVMELCLYKIPNKGPQRDAAGKLGPRWRRGIFLGFNRMSSEYLLWDEGNVVKARAIQRLKKNLRWPIEVYNSVKHGPIACMRPWSMSRLSESRTRSKILRPMESSTANHKMCKLGTRIG